jgi:hypothetical protein
MPFPCWRHQVVGIDQDQPPVIQRTYADDAIWNIDDRYRDPVVSGRTETESDAHINNGHDDAVQIGHAFDEIGTAGNADRRIVAADFLHFLDIDAALFVAQGKGEKFQGRGGALASLPDLACCIFRCVLENALLAILMPVITVSTPFLIAITNSYFYLIYINNFSADWILG